MNDAGRIGFLIKGDYDANATYNFLDIVFYNGNSYVAKKDGITGITPTEKGENWQLFATGGGGQKIDVDAELNETSENPVQNKAIYSEITELKNSVSNGKQLVADAITEKGVETTATDEFQTMADNIGSIKTDPNLQEKTTTLNTTTTKVELTPDENYDGLSKATVSITTQEKTATLATTQTTITPDSGRVLSKVTVPAVTGTAVVGNVLKSKTFNSTAGINQTGTMENYSNTTVDVASGGVTTDTDDTHILVNVPKAGYYDTQSKLRVLNSDLHHLLWTNPNPNNSFAAQTISISELANYNAILLEYGRPSDKAYDNFNLKRVGYKGFLLIEWGNVGGFGFHMRSIEVKSNSIVFGDNVSFRTKDLVDGEKSNITNIPMNVWGVNL